MNKTIKFTLLLTLVLVLIVSMVTLVACKEDEDPNDFVNGQGNTVKVVLDSRLDPLVQDSLDKISFGYIDYRIKPNSPIPQPGKTEGTNAPILFGYIFDGFYEGTVNDDGTLTYGEKWDFSRKISQDMTLYGKWLIQYKIRINYVLDNVLQADEGDEMYITNNAETITAIKESSWADHTFIQLYSDEACKEELTVSSSAPFTHGCTQDNPIRDVYAKFIKGNWKIVRNANDLVIINSGYNLYFMNDIDMSTLNKDGRTRITVDAEYKGTIEGNNYKISNLMYLREGKSTLPVEYTTNTLGLFARLSGATIRNITFENCTVTGSVRRLSGEYFYGFMAGEVQDECVFENITFNNCTLTELQFNTAGGLTPEREATERAKIVTSSNLFVGEGSNYQPNGQIVKGQVTASIKLMGTDTLRLKTTIFC